MSFLNCHIFRNIKNRKLLIKIFLLCCVPVLIICTISIITYKYYINLFEEEAEKHYDNALYSVSLTTGNIFDKITESIDFLSQNEDMLKVIVSNDSDLRKEYSKVSTFIDSLIKFKSINSFISYVYFKNEKSNLAITSNGTMDLDYFNSTYHIIDIDNLMTSNYYKDLRYKIFPTQSVNNSMQDLSYDVIPIVFNYLDTFYLKDKLVVEIDVTKIARLLSNHQLSENGILFITDLDGNFIVSSTDEELFSFVQTDDLIEKCVVNNSNKKYLNTSRGKYLVKHYHDRYFNYFAMAPINDIYSKTKQIKLLISVFLAFSFILSIIISFLISKKIYTPIKGIVSLFKNNKNESLRDYSNNEFDFINKHINNMLNKNETLKKNLSITLPLASEQYLLKLLSDSNDTLEDESEKYILSCYIEFKHSHFVTIIYRLNYTDMFYNTFNKYQQQTIYKSIIGVLGCFFPSNYPHYILTLENNKYCSILNCPEYETIENIEMYIKEFLKSFRADHELIRIQCGVGKPHKDVEGLKQSFKEAQSSISLLSFTSNSNMTVYNDEVNITSYQLTREEENKIYNYLIGSYKDEAISTLEKLIDSNIKNNISEPLLKSLYKELYHIGNRALNNKSHIQNNLTIEKNTKFLANIEDMPLNDIRKYIESFYKEICNSCTTNSRIINIDDIKNYIKNTYSEDIYLDKLANEYNTSSSYISRVFKDATGTTFHKYLSNVRIAKAKDLLIKTNKSINEISKEVGFNSSNVFLRTFKKYEGLPPTKYRDIHSNH